MKKDVYTDDTSIVLCV